MHLVASNHYIWEKSYRNELFK